MLTAGKSELKAEFVESIVADGGRVLSLNGQVTRLLNRSSRASVLAEVLVLRVHLDAGNRRWRNIRPDE